MSAAAGRRGIALPLALFVLAVVGALVAGTFFLGRLEQQSGRNTLFAAQAREAAEAGLAEALAGLEPCTLEALAIGAPPLSQGTLVLNGGLTATSDLRRLGSTLFLLRSVGRRRAGGGVVLATRALGTLVRLAPPAAALPGGRELQVLERGWFAAY